ncbi:MAG: FtsW/RodA/SpoVE family cell cycle protein [bacterium]|nr:FtsW/RodA/SpoVE family cell cycle protein [bacterium]
MFFDYKVRNFNIRLLLYVVALNVIGILVINSASNGDVSYMNRQIIGAIFGIFVAIVLGLADYHQLLKLHGLIYLGSFILLAAVLLVGDSGGGARRWVELPGIGRFQPSEFAKIGMVMFFAWYWDKYQEKINRPLVLGSGILFFALLLGLILAEPDLSTSLICVFMFVCLVYTAGISYRWILGTIAALIPLAAGFIYLLQYNMVPFLHGYQANRILAWLSNDSAQFADANRQQENSMMAIGSGLLEGKGLNNNTWASVKDGNFLSEEHTDFIFAVLGEELGFRGCVLVIALYALIVFECILLAQRSRDLAGRLICVGIASLLCFQAFTNIAVATGLFPNTGLPLPFISYGVSSLFSLYAGIGLVLNVGLQRKITN